MAKQRFVVYKAFNKDGEHMRSLQVVGGKPMSFLSGLDFKEDLKRSTKALMGFASINSDVEQWKQYAMSKGACRFQKVIYFN